MSAPDPIRGTFWQGEAPPAFVLRLAADDGFALKRVDPVLGVDSIAVVAYCAEDALETPIWSTTLNQGALLGIMFDTLQVDGYAFDEVGYNFRLSPTAANFQGAVAGRDYEIVLTVTPTAKPVQKHRVWMRCA